MANLPLGITLPISLGSNGYFSNTVDANEQIRSNLTNLLLTRKGERPFQAEFGCDIYKLVFEPNSDDFIGSAFAEIESAASIWMPFLHIDDVKILQTSEDGHEITLQVLYTVISTNTNDSIVLVF